MRLLMKKVFIIILLIVLIISASGFLIGLVTFAKTKNLYKTNAKVTSIGLPDGAIYGDFTDEEGIFHSDEYLFVDHRFTNFFCIKRTNQNDVEKYIGTEITILYDSSNNKIISYNNLLRRIVINLIISLLSLLCFLYLKWINGKKNSAKNTL